jgi:FHA domain
VNRIEDIFTEYSRMRQNGLDTKTALNALRSHVEVLSKDERAELAALLRNYEASAAPAEPKESKASSIRPIVPNPQVAPPPLPKIEPPVTKEANAEMEVVEWVTCANCGKPNQRHEVFCYSCGQLLEPGRGGGDTVVFSEGDAQDIGHFGQDSVLALRVRGSTNLYELRPQHSDHELIIGRSTDGSAMMPDVDLKERKGADLGVSRLHLTLRYDTENHEVLVTDLGSANGTFINGQRLMPKEVRVLRHGDELRLGKLVMAVSFRHPSAT